MATSSDSWYDPSEVPAPAPPWPVNPLQWWTDTQLEQTLLTLDKACGKNLTVFRRKHRSLLCLVLFSLKIEKGRRDALKV